MPSQPFAHASRTLDFGSVLDIVARYAVNDSARAWLRSLRPTSDAAVVAGALRDIEEYRLYKEEEGDLPIADTGYDVDIDRIATRDSTVSPLAFRGIAAGEQSAVVVRSRLSGAGDYPRLRAIAADIEPHQDLATSIERAIDTDGSIKDTASPALKRIRRDIASIKSSLRAHTERLTGQFGDECLSTVMGSRHMLVVPRGQVRKNAGLVHAASHTGGSLYFEPFSLVELNNDLETKVVDEQTEIARIINELGDLVRARAPQLKRNVSAINRLDALRARARFSEAFQCNSPEIPADGRIRLRQARHPRLQELLSGGDSGQSLVPLDLTLDSGERLMVITGPNAGGKTVTIKTVGVCALLYQCGIQVPAGGGCELPVFSDIVVDIGDEQSMESSLSTFTSHLHHLDEMSRRADSTVLCLIDEIGDGTDPDEGAALAIATLERLLETGSAVIATTHYGRIKTFALETDGVCNASMAFEEQSARPLYRLLQGLAGRSRGLETARRVGFDPRVVGRADELLGSEAHRLETILSRLEATHLALERERDDLRRHSAELDRRVAEVEEKAAEYNLTRKEATRRAMREAESMLKQTRRDIEQIVRTIRERQADKNAIRDARERVSDMLERVEQELVPETPAAAETATDLDVGSRVALNAEGTTVGVIISVENGSATVEINNKRIRIPVERLFAPASEGNAPEQPISSVHHDVQFEPLTTTRLDIRGQDRETAMAAVTQFLDQAVMTGVREVQIVHGVGEGVLSSAVNDILQSDPRVESRRPGGPGEGGIGVTFVQLR